MRNCKYKLRKLSIGLVSVGTMLMTTTALGEETTTTPTTEVTTENQNATSSISNKGDLSNSKTDDVVEETPAPLGITSTVTTELTETTQKNEEAVDIVQGENVESVVSGQTEDVKLSSQEPASLRSKRSTTEAPQTIEVEKFSVDKEKTETIVSDGSGKEKLIKNRDGNPRDIFDISRNVKVNQDGTMDVTLTVKPKQIDEGAEVIVLLDTSQKMTDDDFNTAKENITRLVTTLTSKTTNSNQNYNSRNSVRMIDFYRHIGEAIDLSGKTRDEIENILEERRKKAKDDYNGWGVNLQGAIHKAREIFNLENEKKSGKRQHIVLFSQGESTFSYDIKEKKKLDKLIINDSVISSNPLLPWPLYLDSTTRKANLVEDGKKLQNILKQLGIKRYDGLLYSLASGGNDFLNLGSAIFGTNNPLDYLTLADLDTKSQLESSFDYAKTIGEGYHHRSYFSRETSNVPLQDIVKKVVKAKIEKLKKETKDNYGVLDVLGIGSWVDSISNSLGLQKLEEKIVNKMIDYLFYKRNYIYLNHNLSAQAEAKMARDEGITFHAFDVTKPGLFSKRKKEFEKKEISREYKNYLEKKYVEESDIYKKRNDEFDKYLKEMSEGKEFFTDVDNIEKFKDILSEIKVTETLTDKVNVVNNSWKEKNNKGTDIFSVKYKPVSNSSSLLSFFLMPTPAKESLTWTISKEKLKNAFEQRIPLELTYKLKINKEKLKNNGRKKT